MVSQRQGPPMHEIKRWEGRSATALDMCSDGAGFIYIAIMVNNGSDAWVEVSKFTNDLSTEVDNVRLDPAPEPPPGQGQNKEDAPAIGIVRYPNGQTAVRVVGLSHMTSESTGRPFILSGADITDMDAVFDATNPKHFEAEPLAPGVVEECNCPTKQDIATEVIRQMHQAFGGNIRQGIEDKSKDGARRALIELGVTTIYNITGILHQFIKDRVFEVFSENVTGFWPWLRSKVGGTEQTKIEDIGGDYEE